MRTKIAHLRGRSPKGKPRFAAQSQMWQGNQTKCLYNVTEMRNSNLGQVEVLAEMQYDKMEQDVAVKQALPEDLIRVTCHVFPVWDAGKYSERKSLKSLHV
ncbi:uncharacterized protein [Ptychodera flava]|uniref:uncharacterized protein n=1 Tax=Ptychodera flava TaxID=63121 RepID=UPI003969FD88